MESHLLQMRGLKLEGKVISKGYVRSHLLQMRGLKPRKRMRSIGKFVVASFTDAWIETEKKEEKNIGNDSRIFYRCVD